MKLETAIRVDNKLLAEVMAVTGQSDGEVVVEEGLRLLLRHRRRRAILDLYGKIDWQGNLDESRMS